MSPFDRQIAKARGRLTLNILLDRVTLGSFVGACAWIIVLLAQRLFDLGVPLGIAAGAAGALALLIAIVGTMLRRVQPLHAAVALDEAAGLRERLSTALVYRRDEDPFARATVADADRIAGNLSVPSHLPLRRPALVPWSGSALAVALVLTLALPQMNLLAKMQGPGEEPLTQAAVQEKQQIKQDVEKQMQALKELTAKNPQLADLQLKLDDFQLKDQPESTPDDIRRQAVREIDDVSDKLKEQREAGETGHLEEFKKKLARLDDMAGDDAASKLSQSLAAGDMKGAKNELQKLKDQLAKAQEQADTDPQAKAPMKALGEKLDKLAMDLEKLGDTTQLRKEISRKGGLTEEQAKKLLEDIAKSGQTDPKAIEKMLDQMNKQLSEQQKQELARKISQQQKACNSCQSLGKSLAKAAKSCQAQQQADASGGQGGSSQSEASGALSNAMGQLSDMEMAEALANDLEAQLSQLQDLRDGMCQGSGQCQGQGQPGQPKLSEGMGGQAVIGGGPRPGEQRTAHQTRAVSARGKLSEGKIIGQILVDSPMVDEDATAEVKDAVTSDVRDAQDAVERNQYPRQYHGTIQKYFERYAQLGNSGE